VISKKDGALGFSDLKSNEEVTKELQSPKEPECLEQYRRNCNGYDGRKSSNRIQ
jgi:hypothetical protein